MRVLDNVERIAPPSLETFQRDYVAKRKPVILTNLFRGQPLDEVRDVATMRARFGDVKVPIGVEPTRLYLRQVFGMPAPEEPPGLASPCTLNAYFDFVEKHPGTGRKAPGEDTPREILEQCRVPEYCGISSKNSLRAALFLANAGNVAHLHFDGDGRSVLLYQVFGRKRVTMVPSENAKKLAPIGRFSSVFIENFSDEDRLAFLRYAGAYDTILEPGETAFMPMAIWHHVDYLETGMAIGFRSGRELNRYVKFFSDRLYRDICWLAVAVTMRSEALVRDKYLKDFFDIAITFHKPYPSPEARYDATRAMLERVSRRIAPDFVEPFYALTNFRDFEKVDWQMRGMYQTSRDGKPARAERVSAEQRDSIETAAREHALSPDIVAALAREHFGKASFDDLSADEAEVLLAALTLS